jgi:predicted nucleotide-binding protein (sugar kinase/HSP70/actin superfamily)
MGNNWPAFKALCECMGAQAFLPQANNDRQIKCGLRESPEWVCFPFKATLSNLLEALEAGTRTLLMPTDCGPCRFGFYYAVQERILRDLGYKVSVKHLPQGDLLTFEWVTFLRSICRDRRYSGIGNIIRTARIFLMKAFLIKLAEECEGMTRCYERHHGDTTSVLKQCIASIDSARTFGQLRRLKVKIPGVFANIKRNSRSRQDVPVVGMTGEIFMTLDSFANHDLKRKLGEMGCEVRMGVSLYDWVTHKLHINFHRKYLEYLSRKHKRIGGLTMDIGGEALWVVGEYIDWARRGFDGFVHVYPFTCMPEITAKSIIMKWYEDRVFDFPPLFLGFDEHSGETGLITRLEAYVDLLKMRKNKKI